MLFIDWLLVLPNRGGTTVIRTTATNVDTIDVAVIGAHRLWPFIRTQENQKVSGFQVVDQDGRIKASACFAKVGGLAA